MLIRLAVIRRCLSKKKWSDGIDIRQLSGEEWLRLVAGETTVTTFAGWCARCRTPEYSPRPCSHCGGELLLFDEQFWHQIGHKIKRTLQKDRSLLSRVKYERESLYDITPTFPASLEWLLKSWTQAPRPPHHPVNPRTHYLVANWVSSLRRLNLSHEEIIEVFIKDDFPDGRFERQGKDFAKIPGEDLRKLGEGFRQAVGGNIPSSARDLSEMWRTIHWVDRQRNTPMARLRGQRVRHRKPAEHSVAAPMLER